MTRAGVLLAEGFSRLACVNDDHQVRRFPDHVIATLTEREIAPPGDTLG
jgi:hypothetical protein